MPSSRSSVYKYQIPRKGARINLGSDTPEITAPAHEVMGPINGIMPGSIGEWRAAVSLWKFKLPFEYQVPLFGGRWVAGGQVLDFLVYAPFARPLQIFGEHWHISELTSEERLKLEQIKQVYGQDPVVLWFQDILTQEASDRAIRGAFL